MSILTENSVLSRAKAQDLKDIRKLNCWGSDLVDVSIVRKMTFVEVLSLSVNKISTLADFSFCTNLQELYLRNNNIADLNEICYLKSLPHLHSLWLADNPCTVHENYRFTVLRTLPHLKKLDNIIVQPDEVTKAAMSGDKLKNPSNSVIKEQSSYASFPHHSSSDVSTIAPHISKLNDFGIADEQIDLHSTSIQSLLPENVNKEITITNNFTPLELPAPLLNDQNMFQNNPNSAKVIKSTHPCHQKAFHARVQTMVDYPLCQISDLYHDNTSDYQLKSRKCESVSHDSKICDDPDDTASTGDGYLQILKKNEQIHVISESTVENATCKKNDCIEIMEKQNHAKNVKKLSSNVLTAVLCLVKELDLANLQVVKTAIHCRMVEMRD